MLRKHRRKIVRKKRGKKRHAKRISHLDAPITNRWTKATTYFLMVFEAAFVIWWLQETFLYWQDYVARFRYVVDLMKGWF